MGEPRVDHLAKAMARVGSRRRLVGALLAAIVAGVRARPAAADEGTAIADASGGSRTVATTVEPRPAPGPNPKPAPPPEPCRPEPADQLCRGRCNVDVADGCGDRVRCTCRGSDVCGPNDRCCPRERLCLASGVCCASDLVCAPGGGVCCPPSDICTVGGVADACCAGIGTCVRGICV